MLTDSIALMLAAILLISIGTSAMATRVSLPPSTIFQSNVDGFRVGVPNAWIIEDIDNTAPNALQAERILGGGLLARLCPEHLATPEISAKYSCAQAMDYVLIFRYADLKSRPEFADIIQQNRNITTSDFVAFYLLFLERLFGFTNFRLLEDFDTAVNVTDPQTNQTITTAHAKYIDVAHIDGLGQRQDRDIALLVLANDENTGYALIPSMSIMRPEHLSPEHQEILDSFELLVPNNNSGNQSNPSLVPFSVPQLVEHEQPSSSLIHND
jgi:hypothetical protein